MLNVAAALTVLAMVITTEPLPNPPPNLPLKVTSAGTLGKQAVRYYIRLRTPAVQSCYVAQLGRQPGLVAKVVVQFTIQPTGAVSDCKPGSTDLERCVARAVCGIRFPKVFDRLADGAVVPGSGTTLVRYPFTFRPIRRDRRGRRLPAARKAPKAPARPETRHSRARQPAPAPAPAVTPPKGSGVRPRPAPPPQQRAPGRLPVVQQPRTDDPLEGLGL